MSCLPDVPESIELEAKIIIDFSSLRAIIIKGVTCLEFMIAT